MSGADLRSSRAARARNPWAWLLGCALLLVGATPADAVPPVPEGLPDARIDLASREGVALVQGTWRYSDARVTDVDFRAVGPDRKPSGPPNRTQDVVPHAEARDFPDADWQELDPTTLDARRGNGRVSFNWYRLRVTLPERVGDFDVAGSTAVFEIVVDDYAEVWVDGELPLELGQSGGSVVRGFNAPNRVVVARNAVPGREIQLAVFGINGPISLSPQNFIWVRSASLALYREPRSIPPVAVETSVERIDPALEALVPRDASLERIGEGFTFTEGPVWLPEGALLFSDPNANRIYRWSPEAGLSVFREKSGYDGPDLDAYTQPGSNGLALDPDGRLTIAEHGRRRVVRLEPDGRETVLADHYEGRRLNSPNDLVYRSDGALYFSDPPFGLPRFHDDPRRELDTSGVFLWRQGRALVRVADELSGPNGLAFSPDERFLYVTNWDPSRKVVRRYPVRADGTLGAGSDFFDMGSAPEPEALDGIEVDRLGNLYVSGPGGVWVVSADGRHLGTIRGPELPANLEWGDADRRTLYLTARSGLYRMRLLEPGLARGPQRPRMVRLDPRLDSIVPRDASVETLAAGHHWVEGPVWDARERALYFSDVPANAVFRWREGDGERLFLRPSGYSGRAPFAGPEPGANGLAFDHEGRLLLAQHGDRRIARREPDGRLTVLVDRYEGRRLNSPNDLVLSSRGDLYFTDPPFGLPGTFTDPARELDWQGVYRLRADGALELLVGDLPAPNGIALSPDEHTLYVSNADPEHPVWMAYPLDASGALGRARVFFDASGQRGRGPGAADGLAVDAAGNVFAAGPGGVYVLNADGELLGVLETGVATSNCELGDGDRELFVTAGTRVHRVRLAGLLASNDATPRGIASGVTR